jgi:hypothetical protein
MVAEGKWRGWCDAPLAWLPVTGIDRINHIFDAATIDAGRSLNLAPENVCLKLRAAAVLDLANRIGDRVCSGGWIDGGLFTLAAWSSWAWKSGHIGRKIAATLASTVLQPCLRIRLKPATGYGWLSRRLTWYWPTAVAARTHCDSSGLESLGVALVAA